MKTTHRRFFFFNDTATTEIYTLSLHDALPISRAGRIVSSQPSLDQHQVAQRPLGDQLLGFGTDLGADALRADLHDPSGLLRGLDHGTPSAGLCDIGLSQ